MSRGREYMAGGRRDRELSRDGRGRGDASSPQRSVAQGTAIG